MEDVRYQILINDGIVAQDMNLEYATIFIKAVFHEFRNKHSMTVSIREMPITERFEETC